MTDSFASAPGKLWLLYGEHLVFRLAHRIAGHILRAGAPLGLIDGANRFDIQTIVWYAQEHHLDPDDILQRLFISRGFTCYQIEAAVTERLPAFLRRTGARAALIFGLLDTQYDEQAPMRDVRAILGRTINALRATSDEGISVLLASTDWRVLPEERNRLLSDLKRQMDRVYRLELTAEAACKCNQTCKRTQHHYPHVRPNERPIQDSRKNQGRLDQHWALGSSPAQLVPHQLA